MPLLIGLDCETTGLKAVKGDRIIEIAMAIYDIGTRRRLGSFVERFNPLKNIHPDAQAVHGIKLEDLATAPLYKDCAPRIDAILRKSAVVVAHNADFDAEFLYEEQKAAGFDLPSHLQVICTMLEGRWATPVGKNPSLMELCYACNVPYDPAAAHAALYDVERMMECFWRGVDLGYYKLPETTSV